MSIVKTKIDPKRVEEIIKDAETTTHATLDLYKMLFDETPKLPNWDDLAKIDGYPMVNKDTGLAIMRMFRKHPSLTGTITVGTWFNNGWSSYGSEGLKDWEVSVDTDILKMEEANCG
jgi:hypothetical protein